jgi:hypothetical protein
VMVMKILVIMMIDDGDSPVNYEDDDSDDIR